jgi:hypothetical protein
VSVYPTLVIPGFFPSVALPAAPLEVRLPKEFWEHSPYLNMPNK